MLINIICDAMFIRKCPNCQRKTIKPIDFKKFEPYQCSECLRYVDSKFFLSGFLSIGLALYVGYLYDLDINYGGSMIFLVLFIRWLFLDKVDAILLPLHTTESHDR